MYDKCYFCLDQPPKLKKESTASFFVNFGRSRGTKEPTYITVDKKIFLCAKEFLACPKKIFFLSEGNICSYLKGKPFRPAPRKYLSGLTKMSFTVRRGQRFPVGGESGENVCVFVRDKDLFAFQGERGL